DCDLESRGERRVEGLLPERRYASPMADLEHVLHQPPDRGIDARVQTFYDTGMRVWIGDETNGIQSETTIDRSGNFAAPRKWPEGVTAANWLHEVALRLYAYSKYAKSHTAD